MASWSLRYGLSRQRDLRPLEPLPGQHPRADWTTQLFRCHPPEGCRYCG